MHHANRQTNMQILSQGPTAEHFRTRSLLNCESSIYVQQEAKAAATGNTHQIKTGEHCLTEHIKSIKCYENVLSSWLYILKYVKKIITK